MNIKRVSIMTIAVLAGALLLLPALAMAQNERGEAARVSAQERRELVQELREQRQTDIEQRVDEKRAQVRQDVCERRQAHFSELVPRLANQSTRLAGTIDNVYDRVTQFYESGQLTVADYETFDEAVLVAQANAHAAVEVVAAYEFEFDCENPSLGNQLFGFREAVGEAREALKAYRAELVTLISSLRAAAAEQQANDAVEETDDNETEENEEEADE